jgi:hypothetical protein
MMNRFRREVKQSFAQRGDAALDVIDALSSMERVESPVWVSESPLFQRKFSSIYDVLKAGKVMLTEVRQLLWSVQPLAAEEIAGYSVYGLDCTDEPHPEAETLAGRTQSKKGRDAPKVVGHRYSWLVRLVEQRPSWCQPIDVSRVGSEQSDSQVAVEQVRVLDKQGSGLKAVVADSLYSNCVFLSIFLLVQTVVALVRLRSNQVLYEEAPARLAAQKGRPRKHGPKFKLSAPSRAPDRSSVERWLSQSVRLSAWHGLHLAKLPTLVAVVVQVEFLKADGSARFKRPLFLFWSGPTSVPLFDLMRMYLWRFAIEHMFRFLKQHMGLNTCRSPGLEQHQLWVWCCALAYTQLLLIRNDVAQHRPPWQRQLRQGQLPKLTARQVQRNALPFLRTLGTSAPPPRPAGKGTGRPVGYRPAPRTRFAVIKKCKKNKKTATIA